MAEIRKSALFKRQLMHFVSDYRERAGAEIANKFIDGIEHGTRFIATNPQSCRVYTRIVGKEFRKWRVKGFPHSIYFRLENEVVILEAVYAHRMDTIKRLPSDLSSSG